MDDIGNPSSVGVPIGHQRSIVAKALQVNNIVALDGLLQSLSVEEIRDLIAYLQSDVAELTD